MSTCIRRCTSAISTVLLDLLRCNDTMVNDSSRMMATAIREDDVSNSLQMADLSQVIVKKFFTSHGGPNGLPEEDIRTHMIQCAETFVKTNRLHWHTIGSMMKSRYDYFFYFWYFFFDIFYFFFMWRLSTFPFFFLSTLQNKMISIMDHYLFFPLLHKNFCFLCYLFCFVLFCLFVYFI